MKRRYILAGIFLSFLLGVFLASFLSAKMSSIIGCILFLTGFALRKYSWIPFLLWILFFIFGVLRLEMTLQEPKAGNIGSFATEEGFQTEVIGFLKHFPDKRYTHEKWILSAQQVKVKEKWIPLEGKLLLRIPLWNGLKYGDRIWVSGKLKIPFESEEFSYKKYLAKEEIFSVMAYPTFEKKGDSSSLSFSSLFSLRMWFEKQIINNIPAPESAFARGILIGDRSGFTPSLSNAFRKTGLTHLLALSGYNITIIALAVFFITVWLPKFYRVVLTVLFLGIFVIFVGGGASIVRAAIMGGIGLFVVHSGRKSDGFYLLLFASSLMVFFKPLILLYDPSFQLSLAGVLGLLAFSRPFENFFSRWITSRFWVEILTASLSAQLGVLPLALFLFSEVSLVSPFANLVIVPVVPVAMLFSFLSVLVGVFFPFLGDVLAFVSWNILSLAIYFIRLLSGVPGASLSYSIGIPAFLFLLFSIFLLFLRFRTSRDS